MYVLTQIFTDAFPARVHSNITFSFIRELIFYNLFHGDTRFQFVSITIKRSYGVNYIFPMPHFPVHGEGWKTEQLFLLDMIPYLILIKKNKCFSFFYQIVNATSNFFTFVLKINFNFNIEIDNSFKFQV